MTMTTTTADLLERTLAALAPWTGRTVVVAMSGGVDSALSAALLHRAGASVIGVHMRTWHYNDCGEKAGLATCCSPADAMDARRVADLFGFPFYAMDFEANFRREVIEPFIRDYLAGRTPNPCVNCNNRLKLGSLLAKGQAYGAEAVATGHYGRLADNAATGRRELRVAADRAKDQTYYLFGLSQEQLRRLLMPLGGLTKPQTRELAHALGLAVADKPDSQEICFVSDNDYRRFLREEAALDEEALGGEIVTTRGEVLGRHAGIHNYTIGQRRGLGIAADRPLYVVELDPAARRVIVGYDEDTLAAGFTMDGLNWVGRAPGGEPFRAIVKIRYRSPGQAAWVYPGSAECGVRSAELKTNTKSEIPEPNSENRNPKSEIPSPNDLNVESGTNSAGLNSNPKSEIRNPKSPAFAMARVVFDAPARAITPGQAAVAYDEATGQMVLMGGWIRRRTATTP